MSFWIDSWFSLATFSALLFATWFCLAMRGSLERNILFALWLNWLSVRSIRAIDHDNFQLWLLSDAVTAAVLFSQANKQARSCGALFAALMVFDHYSYLNDGNFEGAGAVAELVGYLSLVIILWGGHVGTAGLGGNFISRAARSFRGFYGAKIRGEGFGFTPMPQHRMASVKDTQKENSGA